MKYLQPKQHGEFHKRVYKIKNFGVSESDEDKSWKTGNKKLRNGYMEARDIFRNDENE